jgi:hypothetical protein
MGEGEESGYTVLVELNEVSFRRRHRRSFEDNITGDLTGIWGARNGSIWLKKNRRGGRAENVLKI